MDEQVHRIFFTDAKRANKGVRLLAAEAATGASRVVLSDSMATFNENASGVWTGNWRLVGDNEILWWSERDGWGPLSLRCGRHTIPVVEILNTAVVYTILGGKVIYSSEIQ